ncbi:MAG: VOC family protein [Pseudonocardia sp.]|nr:VOC family protein [Pseudonocardia sp.]
MTQGRFAYIGIIVADMAKSLAFYRLLGLDVPPEADGEGHVGVDLPGGLHLCFDTEDVIRSFTDGPVPAGPGRAGVGFECPDATAVDTLHARVVDAGYASLIAPFDATWGQRYATVADPDGTEVSLFTPLS